MPQPARLITPQGETIELTPEEYQRIREALGLPRRARTPSEMDAAIRNTFGQYASGPSLLDELKAERAAERARDELKLARICD